MEFLLELVSSRLIAKPFVDGVKLNKSLSYLEQGQHQDKTLKRVASELLRLSNIAKETGFKGAKDDDDSHNYQIYVGNIDPKTTHAEIREYFEKFGFVKEFFVLKVHRTSKNGIVHFGKKQSVEAALNGRPHRLDERLLIVNRSHGRRRFGKEVTSNKIGSPLKAGASAARSNRYSPY